VSLHLYALEHYDRTGGAYVPEPPALLTTEQTRLVAAVHLPADDVVLALVEGTGRETVAAAAAAAGWRVDRLTPAAWLATGLGEPPDPEGEEPCGA
jgi:hypothetical protein